MSILKRTLTLASLILVCSPAAWTMQPLGQPPAPAGQAHAPTPSVSVSTVAAAALRSGTVSSVSPNHQSAVISGKSFKIDAHQTRIFRGGIELGATGLRTGESIRFNLSPADSTQSTLGVVYVN
jgi:uncharacterized Zn-binding protein involved in type VI secretion